MIIEGPITEYETDGIVWWLVFDPVDQKLIIEPQQCSGKTSTPYNIFVGNTKEECDSFISENNLSTVNI